ncbi:MAG: ThiF family adenylyltransferase [Bacteroidota bacterium]|jgi:hypothetical protein
MFQELVNHNNDLRRLVEKGYAVGIDGGYLIIRDIPYLNSQTELESGAFVLKLVFVDKLTVRQDDHQIWFAGSVPYGLDGRPIPNLGGGPCNLALGESNMDIIVQRRFSNKPKIAGKFADFCEKVESYTTIISGPAMESHTVTPYTFRSVEEIPESTFKFQDTLTSRAELTDLAEKFSDEVVAVIGLGGTGAYVLDFLVKSPVREVRGFDLDSFNVHNAFRAPGQLTESELGQPKAEVYQKRYENFRYGLKLYHKNVDSTSDADLDGVTFAFVCVDKGAARAEIFEILISMRIPFIDVGMGLDRKRGAINGMLRVTYYPVENAPKLKAMNLADMSDSIDDVYRNNIQIGEVNALNACLAVLRFKQIRGYYYEEEPYFQLLMVLGDLKTAGVSKFE